MAVARFGHGGLGSAGVGQTGLAILGAPRNAAGQDLSNTTSP